MSIEDLAINSTSFAVAINEFFSHLEKDAILKPHQQYPVEYMRARNGILIQHDLGTGKSYVAAGIMAKNNLPVIFISSKTLHGNMEKTLEEYSKTTGLPIPDHTYITMNASNMYTQVKNAVDKGLHLDDKYKVIADVNLNGKVLIIDEAHNLFNSITNGSGNAMKLFSSIMRAKHLKLVFLTATPIVNHPFELVPCFNMLARTEVLPKTYIDFNRYFVDEEHEKIKNKNKFQNRIVGLVSYYGNMYSQSSTTAREDFPEKLEYKEIKVPMTKLQFEQYVGAREVEMRELAFSNEQHKALLKPRGEFTSSYRRLSRQLSNTAMPENGFEYKNKKIKLYADKIDSLYFKNLSTYSAKFEEIIKNLSHEGKHLIYSSFVNNAGINIIARALLTRGWVDKTGVEMMTLNDEEDAQQLINGGAIKLPKSRFTKNKQDKDNTSSPENNKNIYKLGFIRITGDIDPELRHPLINVFNSAENMNGDSIKVIFISSAGAEGLDLKSVRHVHIVEPYWNKMRVEQVVGRAVRYKSHIQLPADKRNVQTYIYMSDYPKVYDKNIKLASEEETTDISMYERAKKMFKINNQFYQAIAEASIDCAINNKNPKLHCRLCTPNNEQLYLPNIDEDMKVRSPCIPFQTKEVQAEELIVDGEQFAYYTENDDIKILHYDKTVGGYVQLTRASEYYAKIYNMIKSKK